MVSGVERSVSHFYPYSASTEPLGARNRNMELLFLMQYCTAIKRTVHYSPFTVLCPYSFLRASFSSSVSLNDLIMACAPSGAVR